MQSSRRGNRVVPDDRVDHPDSLDRAKRLRELTPRLVEEEAARKQAQVNGAAHR